MEDLYPKLKQEALTDSSKRHVLQALDDTFRQFTIPADGKDVMAEALLRFQRLGDQKYNPNDLLLKHFLAINEYFIARRDELDCMSNAEHVEWKDVAEVAGDIFNVFVGQPELRWAEMAWQRLQEAGLTRFRNELENHIVLCRLLMLGGIYREFCEMAWDESADTSYSEMAEGLELDEYIVGRLYERLPDRDKDDEVEACDALELVVESQRYAVVSALCKGFGGDNGLYESLRNSANSRDEEDGDDLPDGDDIWEPTPCNMQAHEWITEGCYSLR